MQTPADHLISTQSCSNLAEAGQKGLGAGEAGGSDSRGTQVIAEVPSGTHRQGDLLRLQETHPRAAGYSFGQVLALGVLYVPSLRHRAGEGELLRKGWQTLL